MVYQSPSAVYIYINIISPSSPLTSQTSSIFTFHSFLPDLPNDISYVNIVALINRLLMIVVLTNTNIGMRLYYVWNIVIEVGHITPRFGEH